MERENAPRRYTKRERLSNWFYYHKWWLLVGAVIVYVIGTMLWNVLGIGQVKPDYRIAYVGDAQLPADCVAALEKGLAALGQDVNGDGEVSVSLTQHITSASADTENMLYGYAAEVTVLADISEGESYFFLTDKPDDFQKRFQILACLDGSIPAEDDMSGMDKVVAWRDCPLLAAMDLGRYEDTYLDQELSGECQELLANLYLGRRYYIDEEVAAAQETNEAFWRVLTEGAAE